MKKIVLPVEAANYPADCLNLVRQLNRCNPVMLTVAIVPDLDYASLWTVPGGFPTASYLAEVSSEEIEAIDKNDRRIEEFCKEEKIRHIIRKDQFDFALQEICKESRFADLVLISSQHFFENISAAQPNAYMKEMLQHAECPALLVPHGARPPEEVVLAYDGSPSSMFAIREFAHLFPEWCGVPVTVVRLSDKDDPIPDADFLREWLAQHFFNVKLLKLPLEKSEFLGNWMWSKKNPWLVAGSFGRSGWSQVFAKSFITETIRRPSYPVFLAHV